MQIPLEAAFGTSQSTLNGFFRYRSQTHPGLGEASTVKSMANHGFLLTMPPILGAIHTTHVSESMVTSMSTSGIKTAATIGFEAQQSMKHWLDHKAGGMTSLGGNSVVPELMERRLRSRLATHSVRESESESSESSPGSPAHTIQIVGIPSPLPARDRHLVPQPTNVEGSTW